MPEDRRSSPSMPIDLALVEGPLAKSAGLAADDPRLARVAFLAGRGDYDEAASAAQGLIRDRVHDVRLLGAFFLGAFLQGGVTALPAVLDALTGVIAGGAAAFGPAERKPVLADNTLGWLFRTALGLCEFHDKQRDETWTAWVLASDDELVDAIVASIDRLLPAIKAAFPKAGSTEELGKLRAWFDDTYRRIVDRQSMLPALTPKAPQAEPPPPPRPTAPPPARAAPAAAAPADTITVPASPALRLLLQKLDAFETLVARGDLQKAAVVAHDVRRALESFDPKVYLPKLLSSYFSVLSAHVAELSPYWEATGTVGWQALEQFYQVDLEAFVGEPGGG